MRRSIVYGGLLLTIGVAAATRLGVFRPSSGLAVGDMSSAFTVRDVTSPMAGRSLCYR